MADEKAPVVENQDRPQDGNAVHPHVCGENIVQFEQKSIATGSPPRVWGKLRKANGRSEECRFTPTCVGKTCASNRLPCRREVHPHMCGENGFKTP